MRHDHRKRLWLVALLAALTLIAAACGGTGDGDETAADDDADVDTTEAPDDTDAPGDTEAEDEAEAPADGATMVFGTSADPVVLDGMLVSDGESLRAIDQIFEGLVTLEPGGTEVVPSLATSWEPNEEGTSWTFQLEEGVTFHDGEPFNAEAVCFNFDRWYNLPEAFRTADATYYWQTTMGAFAGEQEQSLFDSCEVDGEYEVTINLTSPSAAFIPTMALTNFTFGSPAALEEFGADEGQVGEDGLFRPTGTYGTENPVGTGPFRFVEWNRGDRLVMERNPDYWGEFPGNIETLIFRPIADGPSRLQALQTGEIMGYDLVAPEDFETIRNTEGLQLLERPPFNVGYIGFNQDVEPLQDIAVREAIAHGVNRQELVDAFYAGQGEVATQFMPPSLFGYAEDVETYEYDPELSMQILEEAGYELPVQIPFAYPTDVSRPYMPDPQANFEAMVNDLNNAGFEVQVQSAPWSPDYLGQVDTGQYGLYLLGWTGDFGDPDNFIGTFFQTPQEAWGFENPEIHNLLDEAEAETDEEARIELYEEANRLIMEFLPGLPYVHTSPALAFTDNVQGYVPGPTSLEPFSLVTVTE